jgi:hypothetical protein
MNKYTQGQEFRVKAMFYIGDVGFMEGEDYIQKKDWIPGFVREALDNGGEYKWFNGYGHVTYTVVSFHSLPRPYPDRVFYTRKFTNPDGVEFGKSKLLIRTAGRFKQLVNQSCWPFYCSIDSENTVMEEA